MFKRFTDRIDASVKLCPLLQAYKNSPYAVCLGLARGTLFINHKST